MDQLKLRYGCNPHQKPARIYRTDGGDLPFKIHRGAPGYINLLDALNAWQLVRELKQVFGMPGAASFKHVSPAGAAIAVPLSDALRQAYFIPDSDELSPVATAYTRARGADRLSSFGDFAAVSDTVDVSLAKLLRREVSDAIIAPGYEPEALEILDRKREGYLIIEIDPDYEPGELESREVFGLTFEQKRNDLVTDLDLVDNIVSKKKNLTEEAKRDLVLASIALKYTQSNSVCFAKDGQVIGSGAGQQNRLACVDLAGNKAEAWHLRQHPSVLKLAFAPKLRRPDKINAIEQYLAEEMTDVARRAWEMKFATVPAPLPETERAEWMAKLTDVSLSSDAYFPFRDNIDRAAQTGVTQIVQTGGSINDQNVIDAVNEYEMVMAVSGVRLFHH
ncbi:MAG TPA: phosphoribosylaminoimidazolecarboxamide formyltransferase [Candidatus Latescibacteria bacterium]|jgi:phosphoribosylaminoimidazolecarboxamide formyltransferase/IMP cyclohydrolase|nr:phosphoribosylaminoimidazolecarboxamide formyltransferase [Candidatus Latescibacterota bacterium]